MMRVELSNCRTEPWASYLRGLAVLRLVAEQKDPNATGCFENDRFVLRSCLDREGLLNFFVKEYRPTPVVAPWNGGSGFYPKDDRSSLDRILASGDERFRTYAAVIATIRSWPEIPNPGRSISDLLAIMEEEVRSSVGPSFERLREVGRGAGALLEEMERLGVPKGKRSLYQEFLVALNIRDELQASGRWDEVKNMPIEAASSRRDPSLSALLPKVKKIRTHIDGKARKGMKEVIVRKCRSTLPEGCIQWIDAAMILDADGKTKCPAVLGGSGGNEGNLDYSRTFIKNVTDLLLSSDEGRCRELLANSLFDERTDKLPISPMGMFDPGRAGGFNQGVGIELKDFPSNPWDFVLTLEGSILWASSITRREGDRAGTMSSPFTTRSKGVGYSSASELDAGSDAYEVWAPVWGSPATLAEVRYLMAEGRAYIGKAQPQHSIQFAIALANLSVDRGIREFVRYGILKRRGDSKVMMPLGRFEVRKVKYAYLLEELDAILAPIDRMLARFVGEPPASLRVARRKVDVAILNVVAYDSVASYRALLQAIGGLEEVLALRDPEAEPRLARPPGGMSLEWLLACDDGTPEVRMAGAISSLYDKGLGPWRAHMAPIDPKRPYSWAKDRGMLSWEGGDAYRRMAGSLHRRIIVAVKEGNAHPLRSRLQLHPADVMPLVRGEVDERALCELLWGMNWLNWWDLDRSAPVLRQVRSQWSRPLGIEMVPRGWTMLAAALSPDPIIEEGDDRKGITPDASLVSLLMANRYQEAVAAARRKLFSQGVPTRQAVPREPLVGMNVAASLLVPVHLRPVLRSIVKRNEGDE